MSRVTVEEVRDTFDTEKGQAAISQWIDIASDMVDDIADSDSSISSERLSNIELLVAQHLLAIQDPRVEEDAIGDSTMVYQGETGQNFDATHYGQHAKMLDPTDTLVNKEKVQPSVDVLNSRNVDRPDR